MDLQCARWTQNIIIILTGEDDIARFDSRRYNTICSYTFVVICFVVIRFVVIHFVIICFALSLYVFSINISDISSAVQSSPRLHVHLCFSLDVLSHGVQPLPPCLWHNIQLSVKWSWSKCHNSLRRPMRCLPMQRVVLFTVPVAWKITASVHMHG